MILGRLRMGTLARHAVLIAATVATLVPFAWICSMSLKTLGDAFSLPLHFLPRPVTFEHYVFVLTGFPLMKRYFLNSVIVTSTSMVLAVVVSALAGYAFAHLKFPGRDKLFSGLVATIFLPTGITTIITIFELTWQLGLSDTLPGLIMPYTALGLPIYTSIMHSVFKQIPKEMQEAAVMDGCSAFRLFTRIMLPLSTNGIVTVAVLAFVQNWGEYLIARTITSDKAITLALGIQFVRTNMGETEFPIAAAAYMTAIIPALIIFAVFQARFIRGMTEGALKM